MPRPALALCLPLLLGCSELLDADAYRTASPIPGTGAEPDQGTLLFDEPCNACLDAACDVELSQCETDEECAALLDCVRPCRDPACWMTCARMGPYQFEQDWPLDKVDECAFGKCAEACRIERGNFDCVGAYTPPKFYDNGEFIDVSLLVGLFPEAAQNPEGGWTVEACPNELCAPVVGTPQVSKTEQELDDDGQPLLGRLTYRVPAGPRGFEGYFQATKASDPTGRRYRLRHDDRFTDFFRLYAILVDPTELIESLFLEGEPLSPGHGGYVFAIISDCHFIDAAGVTLEVSPLDPATSPADVTIIYPSRKGMTTRSAPNVGFIAPEGRYEALFRDAEGVEFRRHEVSVAPDVLTSHWVLPTP